MATMFDALFSGGPIPTLEKTVRFTAARHRLILNNVANAETPGYRRRDLSRSAFDEALGRAIERRDRDASRGLQLDLEPLLEERRDSGDGVTRLRILDPVASQSRSGALRHDRNDVDIEKEMALLLRNSAELRKAADLLKKYYGQIRAAITERPG